MDAEELLSVGIDIGTSTSQLIFSRLTVKNTAGYFSVPALAVSEKKILYQGEIYRTPLQDKTRIDAEALAGILKREYVLAGIKREEVKTGAAIITGEAARKENAAVVLEKLSGFAGDFVVSAAGPDMESIIAGKGSGAQKFSEEHAAVVANLDIGGGTTNIVVFDCGRAVGTGCLDIGGRQLILDEQQRTVSVGAGTAFLAERFSVPLPGLGEYVRADVLMRLCDCMAEILAEALERGTGSELMQGIRTKGAAVLRPDFNRPVQYLCFSGGVADCIYNTRTNPLLYGDIGIFLADAVKRSELLHCYEWLEAKQAIRATVIGAGNYTMSISGSTIACEEKLLPLKNVPVLRLSDREEESVWNGEKQLLVERLRWFLQQSSCSMLVLAFQGRKNPDFTELQRFAETFAQIFVGNFGRGTPCLLLLQEDMAKVLGQVLRRRLGERNPVLVLDGLSAEQNDYIDFGYPVMNGTAIPVVVKTLVFG